MTAVEAIKSLFFPYDKEIKKIRQAIKEQAVQTKDVHDRIDKMAATLNGEDDWFLQRVQSGRCHDGHKV